MDNDGGGRDDDEQSHWITSCSSRLYYYYKSHLYTTVYFLDYVPTVWNVWSILNVMVCLKIFLDSPKFSVSFQMCDLCQGGIINIISRYCYCFT